MTVDVAAPSLCPKCSAPFLAGTSFCEKCGANLSGEGRREPGTGRVMLGRLATNTHLKHIKGARLGIAVVALVTLAFTIFMHVKFNHDIAAYRSDPKMKINESVVSQQTMLFFANYVIVAVFAGLWFWTRKNPFAACLTALIIYLSMLILNAAIDPTTIIQGILVKIIIVLALINGVKSGLAYRRMVEKGEIA